MWLLPFLVRKKASLWLAVASAAKKGTKLVPEESSFIAIVTEVLDPLTWACLPASTLASLKGVKKVFSGLVVQK